MSENIITNVEQNVNENNQEITVKYILEQVEKIRSDSKYIYEALEKLESVTTSSPADIGAQAKAQGIETVVQCRETTNQQMLKFYEKLYDDLVAQNRGKQKEKIEKIELVKSIQWSMIDEMRKILDEDDLVDTVYSVRDRIDALCTDVLNDKI